MYAHAHGSYSHLLIRKSKMNTLLLCTIFTYCFIVLITATLAIQDEYEHSQNFPNHDPVTRKQFAIAILFIIFSPFVWIFIIISEIFKTLWNTLPNYFKFKKKYKCSCGWKGIEEKLIQQQYESDNGPLAYASGTNFLCPKCKTKLFEGNSIRS